MPFTLAHPAAVLPLKRFCPRFLSFGALIAGSVAPDVGYAFGPLKLDVLSHTFAGSFIFSLPMGIFMLVLFYTLREGVVQCLPERDRQIFLPLCRQPIGAPLAIVISVLLGAWTHLIWDSFTHTHGWLVNHLPLLQTQLGKVAGHQLLVCHLLWYGSSFLGVAWLCFAYEKWRQAAAPAVSAASDKVRLRNALLVGLLVLPIETLHHLVNNSMGFALVGVCTTLLVLGVALTIGNHPPVSPQKDS